MLISKIKSKRRILPIALAILTISACDASVDQVGIFTQEDQLTAKAARATEAGAASCIEFIDGNGLNQAKLTDAGFRQQSPAIYVLEFDETEAGVLPSTSKLNGSNLPRIEVVAPVGTKLCRILLFRVGKPFAQSTAIVRKALSQNGWRVDRDRSRFFTKGERLLTFSAGGSDRPLISIGIKEF